MERKYKAVLLGSHRMLFNRSQCELTKGAKMLLEHLQAHFVSCGIVSADDAGEIDARLKSFGIWNHFRHVVGGQSNKKDTLVGICEMLKQVFKIESSEVLYLCDRLSEIKVGNEANLESVFCPPADYRYAHLAKCRIRSLGDLTTRFEFTNPV